jgi:hypothetical protein
MRIKPVFYCDRCDGLGGWIDYDSSENIEFFFQCPDCNGTGISKDKKYKHERTRDRVTKKNNEGDGTGYDGDKGSPQ